MGVPVGLGFHASSGALCLVAALGVINLLGDRISDALVLPLIIVLASLPIQTATSTACIQK